jgi:hypothetical protein
MRYDTPIYFQRAVSGKYNPDTGNYDDDTVTETKRYASITDSSTNTLLLVYGAIKQGSLTIRIQQKYEEPFDYIRIENKRYRVDRIRTVITQAQCFIVSEVQ